MVFFAQVPGDQPASVLPLPCVTSSAKVTLAVSDPTLQPAVQPERRKEQRDTGFSFEDII